MYYSAQTGGFYTTQIHGDNIPVDAVKVTPEQHEALISGQSLGKVIAPDENGYPVLQNPPPIDPRIPRIAELKLLLQQTDYKALPDYDGETEQALIQRQLWRDELRMIEYEIIQDGQYN